MSAALHEDDFARRAAELRDRVAAAPPQSWRPDEGHPNPIVGELIRVDDGSTAYQPRVKIAVLQTPEEGEWGVWLLHDVLRDEFQRQRPQVGELVAVYYGGKSDKGYVRYRVAVDRDGSQDWSELTVAGDAPAASPRHFAGVEPEQLGAPPPLPAMCEQCGYEEPEHAPGCPLELPY